MGRERRRRQAHQREEERLNSTSKPRWRATEVPRVFKLLLSVPCDLAWTLDGKREERTCGYPFIASHHRFRLGIPRYAIRFG
jgi:hypothetical protein